MSPNIAKAIEVIRQGGVIAYPTEAVYGLGCDPQNPAAVERLLALKQRAAQRGLILIASELDQLQPYLLSLDTAVRKRVSASWPGPETWVLPARPEVSRLLRGNHNSLAVRVTAHPLARELCSVLGHPLVSTSANRSGQPPARIASEVTREFGNDVDYVLHGQIGALDRPTRIRDGLTGKTLR